MKISIITPSFNQGRFIGRMIRSVKEQTGNFELEHIVLDNCSSDQTGELLEAYRQNPGNVQLRVLIEKDEGQTAAINTGFSLATGDVVCWLNTDEWLMEGALSRVQRFLEGNPEIDVVFGDCDFVDADARLVRRKREPVFTKSMLLFYGCFIPSCSTFVRRRVIDAGLILDPAYKVVMDFDWYVRMAQSRYKFAHLPAVLASFTWHDSNISAKLVQRRACERRSVQDRYAGVKGPSWFRSIIYGLMRVFWVVIRIIRRRVTA